MAETNHRSAVMGLRIVTAGFEHVDRIAPLFDAYRQFYEQEPDPEAAWQYIHDRISLLESVIFLAMGEIDGEDRTLGFVQLYPGFSSVSMKRIWNLNDLYVAPEARRTGVGRALIRKAHELAEATDAIGLILSTSHYNQPSIHLYHSCGFVRDDEFAYYFLPVDQAAHQGPRGFA